MSTSNFLEILTVPMAAGEVRNFMVSGAYFEVIDATSPIDVRLTDKFGAVRGAMRNAEASFYLRASEFDVIEITSAAAQVLRIAFGTAEAGTRRAAGTVAVSGIVNTLDNGINVTKNNRSFFGVVDHFASAGNLCVQGIWNPLGSGKNVIIEKIIVNGAAAGSQQFVRAQLLTAIFGTLLTAPVSLLGNGFDSTTTQVRGIQTPTAPIGKNIGSMGSSAGSTLLDFREFVFGGKIVLPQGSGISINTIVVNSNLSSLYYFSEETA